MILVIQENLRPTVEADLTVAARKAGFQVLGTDIIPFANVITDNTPSGAKIPFGSTSLMRLAVREKWEPGIFWDEWRFEYRCWSKFWGNRCLNQFRQTCQVLLKDLPKTIKGEDWEYPFFVRPSGDFKQFAGRVFHSDEEFGIWHETVLMFDSECDLTGETRVIISPFKSILLEYRFFIVGGRISSYCKFRRGDDLITSPEDGALVGEDVVKFVEETINHWKPHHSFVLDVCVHEIGEGEPVIAIVEPNCLNASGFYTCNPEKVFKDLRKVIY